MNISKQRGSAITARLKHRLAATRHLFDWAGHSQVVPISPAHTVRGPRHVVTSKQTSVFDPAGSRAARQHTGGSLHRHGAHEQAGTAANRANRGALGSSRNRLLKKWAMPIPVS